jgi:hypothetical protein
MVNLKQKESTNGKFDKTGKCVADCPDKQVCLLTVNINIQEYPSFLKGRRDTPFNEIIKGTKQQ